MAQMMRSRASKDQITIFMAGNAIRPGVGSGGPGEYHPHPEVHPPYGASGRVSSTEHTDNVAETGGSAARHTRA